MGSRKKVARTARDRHKQYEDGDPLLACYLDDIADSTPLTAREEVELAGRMRAGDEKARNALVEANLRFVVSVAKKYQNRGLSLAELISAGNVGLLTAAERFDETRGYKFISYAVWWIRQTILQTLMEQTTVRMPVNRIDLLNRISRAYETLQQEGRRATLEKVSGILGFTEEKIDQVLLESQPIRSLDAPFAKGDEHCLLDYLPNDLQLSPEEQVLHFALREAIDMVLSCLNAREAEVLRLYFGLDNEPPLTLDQIGMRFKLTRERVRQIKEVALGKLRQPRFCARLKAYVES